MERAMKQAAKAKDASPHWVFTFGAGRAEGDAAQRDLLGGKGAYLAEMSRLGLPVPPGLTISSEVCAAYYQADKTLPKALLPMVSAALEVVGKVAGARFGDVDNPLLVSVRSGSRASMPGMMDTVLNLGLNDQTVEGLARRSSRPRFAYDTYRRFIQMYADVVLGIDHEVFEETLENYKSLNGFEMDTELKAEHWSEVIEPLQGAGRDRSLASPSRRICTSSFGARSPPCSAPGTTRAPSPIGGCTTSPTLGAPRSPCRPWCSAIWASAAPPASCSPAILQPAPTSCTANFWSMRKARTWSPGSVRRSP